MSHTYQIRQIRGVSIILTVWIDLGSIQSKINQIV